MVKELEHLQKLEDMANEKYDSKEVYEHSIPIEQALKRIEEKDKIIHKYELLAKRGERILEEDKPSEKPIGNLDKYIETLYDNKFEITTIMDLDCEIFRDTYRCNTSAGSWNLSCIDFAYTLDSLINGTVEMEFRSHCQKNGVNPELMKIMKRRIPRKALWNEKFKNEIVPSYFINATRR